MKKNITPTNVEAVLRDEDFIVSKTDLKGLITYGNEIFMEFAKYKEYELLKQNHNIIRHPDMPRAVFKLLWDTIKAGNEINAYVKNMSSDGSFYWVYANVSPVIDINTNKIKGYNSVRRKPKKRALDVIEPIYKQLREVENKNGFNEGMKLSTDMLNELLESNNVSYEKFVATI
ncbi:MAG: PAS domain S-box protein [Melioribacteraceae bacterium]|nr:PAS domain S-box protein [Melioribacteraceae bacterium]